MNYDVVIRNVRIFDGTGSPEYSGDVALKGGLIAAIGNLSEANVDNNVDGKGFVLAPGFIDVHTHDDTNVIRQPEMLPKISQGVTTVIVGNCGISASPVSLTGEPPDPMNLLGIAQDFKYATFQKYRDAVDAAQPSVNVAALIGHTALRNNHMDRLNRTATHAEIFKMREQLHESLSNGALGLSTGLAYGSAIYSSAHEIKTLAEVLTQFGGIYTTHLRTEFDGILDAMNEAFDVGVHTQVPVIISHLKCAGAGNWGRSGEVISAIEVAAQTQSVGCDCYPTPQVHQHSI